LYTGGGALDVFSDTTLLTLGLSPVNRCDRSSNATHREKRGRLRVRIAVDTDYPFHLVSRERGLVHIEGCIGMNFNLGKLRYAL
jgi:hypothetical protein